MIKTKVVERSTGELSFGAGFSTQDGVLGDVRLTERNLLGRGQDLRANFTVSQRRQQIDLSFTEPYFLERDLAAGFDLFRSRTDFQRESSYDETSTGGTLRLGYPLTENLRHSVRYTLRADEIQNVDDDASVFIQDEEGERTTSLVGQTFSYDRRDVRFLPSEGYYIRLDQDLAGLGFDNRYIRHELRAEYYLPDHPRRGVQSERLGGAHPRPPRRGRAPLATASSSAAPTCAASSSAASARATRRPTTGSAATPTMSARPSCASRWACRRSCASSAAASSTPAR